MPTTKLGFCCGGDNGFFEIAYDDFNRIYDPANDSWSFGAPLPQKIRKLAAVNINDTIYVLGRHIFPEIIANINAQYIPANYSYVALATPTPATSPAITHTPSVSLMPAPSTSISPASSSSECTTPSGSASPTPSISSSNNKPDLTYVWIVTIAGAITVVAVVVVGVLAKQKRR